MSQLEPEVTWVTKSAIPAFLQDSEFYLALSEDIDGEISVPLECFKEDDLVESVADFKQSLTTFRFWGARSIPRSIVEFPEKYLPSDDDSYERNKIVAEFANDLTYLRILKSFCPNDTRQQLEVSIKAGEVELIKHFFRKGYNWLPADAKFAAEFGRLDCLKFIHETGGYVGLSARYRAAANGHLNCLKYLLRFNHELGDHEREEGLYMILELCATHGQLECLAYAYEHGCAWSKDVCYGATKGNQLACLQYAVEHGCPLGDKLCNTAAFANALDCLKYLHSIGSAWDATTCEAAAMNGHLQCLQYLHEEGCPWDEQTCSLAAQQGFLECLKYVHEHGCPWNAQTVKSSRGECHQYAVDHGCPQAW